MLRSLYTYKSAHARTLSFTANENFLEIGISKDSNWVHVISEKGSLGYVPKNYVAVVQAPPTDMLEIIDTCIEGIHHSASENGGNYSPHEHSALQELIEMRQEWHSKVPPLSHPSKRPAPPPPHRSASHISVYSTESSTGTGPLPSPVQPPPPINSFSSLNSLQADREDSGIEVSTSFIGRGESLDEPAVHGSNCNNIRNGISPLNVSVPDISGIEELITEIPKGYFRQVVEDIRANTNISYATSHQVVSIVFKSLGSTFPALESFIEEIIADKTLRRSSEKQVNQNQNWKESTDGRKLVEILEKLRQFKDDDQQRSWALHEDEHIIKELLNSMIDVLTNGDMEVCKSVVTLDDHRPLLTIVQYYQMETRWQLRKLLLQAFAAVCQMSSVNVSYLSASILPLELTRVIMHSKTSEEELQYTVLVLGMVLSMGDTLPYTHFSIMNESFVEEVLNGIECYNEYRETEHLAELFMTLILAFNLQNHITPSICNQSDASKDENIVIKVLSQRNDTKFFIEKLLLLFNREEDPVAVFDHEPRPRHSVLSTMLDVFGCPKTAQLLYTNDEKVVCDIILRQLTDLPPEDTRRCNYLHLLEGIVTLGRWKEHNHRRKEFVSRLNLISGQEDCPSDQEAASRILKIIQE